MQTERLPTVPSDAMRDRRAAPLRPLDRAWLRRRAVKLDPRRHPSVSGAVAVAWLLRGIDPATHRLAERLGLPRFLAAD